MLDTVDTDRRFTPTPFAFGSTPRTYHVSREGTAFAPGTPVAVALALDALRSTRTTVRVFLGDQDTGAAWPEENDVVGTIGRSMGPCKVPLLVPKGEDGGVALCTDHVVGLLAKDGWRWRHPTLDVGVWEAVEAPFASDDGRRRYKAETRHNGTLYGRHATLAGARRLMAFMMGQRLHA